MSERAGHVQSRKESICVISRDQIANEGSASKDTSERVGKVSAVMLSALIFALVVGTLLLLRRSGNINHCLAG